MNKTYSVIKPDWEAIATEVSRQLGEEKTVSLIVNVAKGWTKSEKIMNVLRNIAPEYIRNGMTQKNRQASEGTDSAPGADGVYRLRDDMPAGNSVDRQAKDPRGTMRTRHSDRDNNK